MRRFMHRNIYREEKMKKRRGRWPGIAFLCGAITAGLLLDSLFSTGLWGVGKGRAGLDGLRAEAAGDKEEDAAGPDSYEIHLLLDSDKLLDEDHQLKEEYDVAFDTKEKCKEFGLVYCDTADRQFNKEGWINRIRFREDKPEKGFKVTFKKRYPVSDGDISGTMKQAEADGFDLTGKDWSTEIEMGYSEMTLSLSAESECEAGGYESIADLDNNAALSMLEVNMPKEEVNWSSDLWGSKNLESARLAGPVYFKRYTGSLEGQEVKLEVWTIKDQESGQESYLTELSFEADDYDQAAELREKMIEDLDGQGILLKEDGLKTQKILNAYLGNP